MRIPRFPGTGLAVVALAACVGALAGEGRDDPCLPFSAVARAERGDWQTLRSTLSREGGGEPVVTLLTMRVVQIEGDTVTVEISPTRERQVFSRSAPPTLRALLGSDPKTKITDFSCREGTRTIGGRELACSVIEWKAELPMLFKVESVLKTRGTLWLSKDVRGLGVVAIERDDTLIGYTGERERRVIEVTGFGREGTVEWGEGPVKAK